MSVDKEPLTVYRASTSADRTRAGTKNAYTVHGSITAQLSPIKDSVSLEIYGERVTSMLDMVCDKATDIELNDKIQRGDEFYKIVAVQYFKTHTAAQIERTAVQ